MAIAIAIYAREPLRSVALPLAAISGDIDAGDVLSVVKAFRDLVGGEILDKLGKLFDEALRDEIHRALNIDHLEREFPMLVEKFWARLALPLIELSYKAYTSNALAPKRLREVEEELAKAVARKLRLSEYERVDDLLYALSVLVDRDLWIIDRVAELGLEGLVKRFIDRALDVVLQLVGYTTYLAFAWTSASTAVLGIAKEYKRENRDLLAAWCREYAKEIEEYLDTLDLLLDDELYSDLQGLGVIKR